MYQCKLQIEGLNRQLSLEDGINLKDLITLLDKLSKCLGKNAIEFTLVNIENTSYSPILETNNSEVVEMFNEIHQNISSTELERLSKERQDYANELSKILFANNLFLTVHNSIDETTIKLSSLNKLSSKQYYFSVTTIYGKIISLYGKNEDNPSIEIKTSSGQNYRVYVTPDQEKEVSRFYKDLNLRIRVRLKKDVQNGKVLHGDLIGYVTPNEATFLQSIEKVKLEYGDIFKNISDSAKLLSEMRRS